MLLCASRPDGGSRTRARRAGPRGRRPARARAEPGPCRGARRQPHRARHGSVCGVLRRPLSSARGRGSSAMAARSRSKASVTNTAGETWGAPAQGCRARRRTLRRGDGRAVLRIIAARARCQRSDAHHLGVPTTRALSHWSRPASKWINRDLLYDGQSPPTSPAPSCAASRRSFLRVRQLRDPFVVRDDHDTLRRLVDFTRSLFFSLCAFYPGRHCRRISSTKGHACRTVAARLRMDARRIRPRRDEHRQHTDPRPHRSTTARTAGHGAVRSAGRSNITDASGRLLSLPGNQPAKSRTGIITQLASPHSRPSLPDLDPPRRASVDAFPKSSPRSIATHDVAQARADRPLARPSSTTTCSTSLGELSSRSRPTTLFRLPRHAPSPSFATMRDAFYDAVDRPLLDAWLDAYAARVAIEAITESERADRMNACNPIYVPRNYLVQEVIEVTERGDRAALAELSIVLCHLHTAQPGCERLPVKRPEWARQWAGLPDVAARSGRRRDRHRDRGRARARERYRGRDPTR